MAETVLMPKQGNTVESCVILEWKKREGDTVDAGDILCEVETDKATFEIAAEHGGRVLKILHGAGEDVPVLQPIAYIGEPGEEPPAEVSGRTPEDASATADSAEEPAGVPGPTRAADTPRPAKSPRLRISPRARNYAAKHGIRPEGITGSGPGGRILEADVHKALETAPGPAAGPSGTEEYPGPAKTEPVSHIRTVIARRMLSSLAETAQLTLHASADARDILACREQLKGLGDASALSSISVGDMVMWAAGRTLREYPFLNAHFHGDTVTTFSHVHLGFAVDTPKGLMVPTIRYADTLSLARLSAEKRRLSDICRSGKAGPEELIDATFTVTNLGSYGVERFTPVLNPPQVGILGICSIRTEPVVEEGETRFIPRIGLSLTVDHQAVDGAPAARFLSALGALIAEFRAHLAE